MNERITAQISSHRFLALPFTLWAVLFIVLPLFFVLGTGLTNEAGDVTLANLLTVLQSEYLRALGLSVELALASTFICLLLAYPLCLILREKRESRGLLVFLLFLLPLWMNSLLTTMAWQTILEKHGLINMFLSYLGLPAVHLINTPAAIIIGMVYNFLPYMVLPLYVSLSRIDESIVEAARDLGANFWQTLRHVLLPLSLPGIVSGCTMVFIPALTTFVISALLGGNKVLLVGNIIEQEFTAAYDWQLGSALSMVLIAQSFNASRYRGQWTGFTWEWYGRLMENEEIIAAFTNTLTIGVTSAVFATMLALVTALGMRQMGSRGRMLFRSLANVPLLNADIVTGISLMLLFLGLGLRLGYDTILLAHIVISLPYAMLCILPQVLTMDDVCYEAARDLGATPFTAFRKVILPELLPGILAAFLLSFAMSADDFIVTYFTKGAGIETLTTEIYSELKLGVHPEMYALSALFFCGVLVFSALLMVNYKVIRRYREAGRRGAAA